MKIVLALLVIALCYVNAEMTAKQKENVHAVVKECKKKTSVTDADVHSLMQHKIVENKAGKCFLGCIMKTMGILDTNNKVVIAHISEIIKHIDDPTKAEALTKVTNTCAAEVYDGDECEVSTKLMKCFIREVKAAGIEINSLCLFQ